MTKKAEGKEHQISGRLLFAPVVKTLFLELRAEEVDHTNGVKSFSMKLSTKEFLKIVIIMAVKI